MPRGRVSQDWTGQIFYNCKLLEPVNKNEIAGYKKWKIQCHCGKIFEAPPSSLKQGMYQSCGCYRKKASKERMLNQKLWNSQRKEYIGKEYNNCKILELVNPNEIHNNKSYYKIECKCGKIFEARASNVQSGVIKSCGCSKFGTKDWVKKRRIENGFDPNMTMMEASEYLRRTLFPFTLKKIIYKRDNNKCQLCNIKDPGHMKVHHIIPVKEFLHSKDPDQLRKTFNHKNLILLCEPCHIYSAHNGNSAKDINTEIQKQLIEINAIKKMEGILLQEYELEINNLERLLIHYLQQKL